MNITSIVPGITLADSANLDAFSRLRISSPENVFDCQFTYGLQPLIFDAVATGSGATITHDATNRNALLTFSSTPTGGSAIMQSFDYHRYQPLKSQLVAVTFNFRSQVANTLKFAGYSDGVNGIEFQNDGTTNRIRLLSSTTNGNTTVNQAQWNLDKLNGLGKSGITLDITESQILIIDFQALYLGRVRVGFDIGGNIIYVHEFNHSNLIVHPYIADANLPIRVGMTCTGTVSTTMTFQCSAVASEGGSSDTVSFDLSQDFSGTAGSGARTHAISLRPKTTFNSITNRVKIGAFSVDLLDTGNQSISWELCLRQAISGTTTYTDVNATYSAVEYNTAGTTSSTPSVVIARGFVAAAKQSKTTLRTTLNSRYPITLNAAGTQRALGTLTLIVTGIGGSSTYNGAISWKEIR